MTNVQDIHKLLADDKFDEADAVIKATVNKPLEPRQKGAALVSTVSSYVKISNDISKGYRDALREAIDALKAVKKKEVQVEEKISLDEVREKLSGGTMS